MLQAEAAGGRLAAGSLYCGSYCSSAGFCGSGEAYSSGGTDCTGASRTDSAGFTDISKPHPGSTGFSRDDAWIALLRKFRALGVAPVEKTQTKDGKIRMETIHLKKPTKSGEATGGCDDNGICRSGGGGGLAGLYKGGVSISFADGGGSRRAWDPHKDDQPPVDDSHNPTSR